VAKAAARDYRVNKTKGCPTGCSAAVSNIDWQPGTRIAASMRWPIGDRMETELF